MKHRPYFSNTLSPTQVENLVKYASGVLGIMAGCGVTEEGAGAWRRLMSLGLVCLTLTPRDELSPGSLFPGSPRFLIWKVRIVNEWSSVFLSIPLLWGDIWATALHVLPSHSWKRCVFCSSKWPMLLVWVQLVITSGSDFLCVCACLCFFALLEPLKLFAWNSSLSSI